MSGFKNFIMRGNLVELAVAVVIGTQFSNLVKQFVASFINPLLALFGGKPNFSNLVFTVGKKGNHQGIFTYGTFLTEVLTFLISALVVYFVLVMPVSRLLKLVPNAMYFGVNGCSGPVARFQMRPTGCSTESDDNRRTWRRPGCRSGRAAGSTRRRVQTGLAASAAARGAGFRRRSAGRY